MTRDLEQEIDQFLGNTEHKRIGVAVSGGGDSMALLHLLVVWAEKRDIEVQCVTVDHQLRPEAQDEAIQVASWCDSWGVQHDILRWDGWDGQGNTQAQAREARYRLIAEWAQRESISAVALGHTQDDQAETVVMRLMRGAGVDGLSAMAPKRVSHGLLWLRPLLDVSRLELRAYLNAQGVDWADDPSNDDMRFDRIKARKAMATLDLPCRALAQVAANMQTAQRALDVQTETALKALAKIDCGALQVDWQGFCALPQEIQRRLLIAAFNWLSGSDYPPRGQSVVGVLDKLRAGKTTTLDGCLMLHKGDALWIIRELKALEDEKATANALWDGRWRCETTGAVEPDVHIAALGAAGLAECPDWRRLGIPRDALLATPAVWQGRNLVAAPLVKPAAAWQAVLTRGESALFDAVFSH